MTKNCEMCFALSLYGIFTYSFTWTYLTFTLQNLKVVLTDPIKGILKPHLRLLFYTIFSFVIAALITLLSFMIDVYGISPMLTCFVRTEFHQEKNKLKVIIFNFLPFISIIYSYYLLFFVLGKSRFRKNKHLLAPFMKYVMNVGLFYLLNTPLFLILIISSFEYEIKSGTFMGWFSYVNFFEIFFEIFEIFILFSFNI